VTVPAGSAGGSYFVLSYTPATLDGGPDHWVSVFHRDLSTAVFDLARPYTTLAAGFYDGMLPGRADWRTGMAAALGTAEVLVPLYSPRYLVSAWARIEREAFEARVHGARPAHVQPVLWVPLPPGAGPDDVDGLGADVPEYGRNGMRALCLLTVYRRQYRLVVDRLARRIVETAERDPVGPSTVSLAGSDVPVAGERFAVAVLVPAGGPGAGRRWCPFSDVGTPAVDLAAAAMERAGMPAEIVDGTAPGTFAQRPGIVLVDPAAAADPAGAAALRAAARDLPVWVRVLVVADRSDPDGASLIGAATGILSEAGIPRVRPIGGPEEFMHMAPTAIAEAHRRFLRASARTLPATGRPRLRDPLTTRSPEPR
jgi:hypothetical protein